MLCVWRSAKIKKNMLHFELFWTQGHIVLEITKPYSFYSFDPIAVKLYKGIAYRGVQTITCLGNRQSLKNMWHFLILTWESMGKS